MSAFRPLMWLPNNNISNACVQQYACWLKVKRRDEGWRKDNGGHEKTSPK